MCGKGVWRILLHFESLEMMEHMMFHMHSICLWTVANYKVFQNEISRFKEDMIS